MSLMARWTLVLVVLCLALLAGVAGVLEWAMRDQQAQQTASWREAREAEIERRLELVGRRSMELVAELAAGDELPLLLAPLVAGARPGERAQVDWASLHAARFGLDELVILDEDGRIVSAALWPAAYGQVHPRAIYLAGCTGDDPVLWRSWEREGERWLVGGVALLRLGDRLFRVAGGTALGETELERLAALAGLRALAWGPARGGDLALELPARWQAQRRETLRADPGPPPAVGALRALRRQLALLAFVLVALSLMIAPWLARGLSRPLVELSSAVEDIGRGGRRPLLPHRGPTEVMELSDAIARMAEGLERAEDRIRLAERRGAWREIARRIAHEIRNALTPLSLAVDNVETAVRRSDDAGRRALETSLVAARDQLQSLERLVSEFHGFARTPRLQLAAVEARGLCEAAAAGVRQARPDASPRVGPGEGLPALRGDAEQLRRALHNLLLNAVEAGAGDAVELDWGAGPGDDRWWLEVRDRGEGLREEIAARLGEPYLTTKEKGTGLGLAVVMQIAEAHGGRLQWRNRRGGGLVMRLELLRDPPAPPEEEEA